MIPGGGVAEPAERRRRRVVLGSAIILAMAMALFSGLRWRVVTDITHFLPAGTDHALATISRQLADSALTRTLILSIRGGDAEAARLGARTMAERLVTHPEVAWVQRGPTPALAEAVYRLYAPRLPFFVSDRPEIDIPAALNDGGLATAARALKRQLSLPTAPMFSRLAPTDPLQWFPAILRRLEQAQARTLEVDGDQLFAHDHRHAIIFLGTRHSPFNSTTQAPLLREIAAAFEDANRRAGGNLFLERAGVAPIALDAEIRIRRDLERISILSTLAVALLFLVLFGSVRSAFVALLPVVGGALTATTAGFLVFGRLHSLTLAIGSSLIGVAIDYPILLLTHRVLAPREPAMSVMRRIWVGIMLGGLTTAAGFGALGWTSFPGVRELALTSAVGVAAALAVTRYVLPLLLDGPTPPARLLWAAAAGGAKALAALNRRRWLAPLSLALVALTCLVGLPRLRWMDSLATLNAADPILKAETDRVRARVSNLDEGRLVVASGANVEEALRINDEVSYRLQAAQRAGALGGFVSLHAFVWSADLQRRNATALAAVPDLAGRAV
ncbi:MAG: MMPL family transporter, partial [Polyangia bacterium]